ncbi:MAG: CDP-glycerol glycerophosphotransferase family protein, partial [Clostridia bacterium]|nr:CDP-glycerol glycerophosphotransferase family protein [Clostridia bacterium]
SKQYSKFLKAYASAGTVFLTESMLPAFAVKRRSGTRVVQLWHGSGAFKKWGYSTLDKSFGASRKSVERFPMHNCYTLVPVSSPEVIPHWASAFNCDPSIIKPLGVPRTDEFFDGVPPKSEKKTILYAPTFRGNNVNLAHNDDVLDIEALKESLGSSYTLLLKMHPFVKKSIKIPESCKGFCLDISDMPTNEALKMADILITDYSSIIFEYSLLGRPMVFYAYDLESYLSERDFYYPYESFVPGPIAKTQDSLVDTILSLGNDTDTSAFADKYMSACDGHSTERIISELGF